LQKRRALKARREPVISYTPITSTLVRETEDLMKQARPHYPFDAWRRRPPANPTALFDLMRRNDVDWKRSIAGPSASMPASLPAVRRVSIEREFNQYLSSLVGDAVTLRVLTSGVLEYDRPVSYFEAPNLDSHDSARVRWAYGPLVTERVDCDSGSTLPLSFSWRDREGKVLLRKPVSVKDALAVVQRQVADDERGRDWRWGPSYDTAVAGDLCRIYGQLKANETPSAEPQEVSREALPFGLTAQRLAQETTPEAMLLVIRAAWRNGQP